MNGKWHILWLYQDSVRKLRFTRPRSDLSFFHPTWSPFWLAQQPIFSISLSQLSLIFDTQRLKLIRVRNRKDNDDIKVYGVCLLDLLSECPPLRPRWNPLCALFFFFHSLVVWSGWLVFVRVNHVKWVIWVMEIFCWFDRVCVAVKLHDFRSPLSDPILIIPIRRFTLPKQLTHRSHPDILHRKHPTSDVNPTRTVLRIEILSYHSCISTQSRESFRYDCCCWCSYDDLFFQSCHLCVRVRVRVCLCACFFMCVFCLCLWCLLQFYQIISGLQDCTSRLDTGSTSNLTTWACHVSLSYTRRHRVLRAL